MKTVTPSHSAFQVLMDEMLSAELSIERYITYIATRRVKSSEPNLVKLFAKSGGVSPQRLNRLILPLQSV